MKPRRLIVWFIDSYSTCDGFRLEYLGAVARPYPNLGSFLYCAESGFTGTLVQRLACFEHLNELQQSPLASLRFFCVVQSIENGIAVLAVERFEELSCNR